MKTFLKEKFCDLSALAVTVIFYGGMILVACGLCTAKWSLCLVGLMSTAVATVVMAVANMMDELRSIAGCNTPIRALLAGWRLVAGAAVYIFLWLAVMPVVSFVDNLMKEAKGFKASR